MKRAVVIRDDATTEYDFGPSHPLSPLRQVLALRLSQELGLLDGDHVEVLTDVPILDDATLLRVHTPELIGAVRAAGGSTDPGYVDARHGIGTADTPAFPRMHEAAARVCGATVETARAVLEGRAEHAVNLSGGLHHGMPDRVSGFCVYNDAAVGIRWLLDHGVERVAYVDVDVHHGDGVQAAFWDEPRVMTLSIHESPATLFPGTGWPTEVGGPHAVGSAVNIALPAGTGDQGWLRALQAVMPPLLDDFEPQVIVSQHGCDAHFRDPLASMAVSVDGMRLACRSIHNWAHRHADGKWIALGGGGYSWVEVAPRAWANVVAEAVHEPVSPDRRTPPGYVEFVDQLLGDTPPPTMTDGADPWAKSWDLGYDPSDPVDAAIQATRRSTFPLNGLVSGDFAGF